MGIPSPGRDLIDKDPGRKEVNRDTIVLSDVLDVMLTEVPDGNGGHVQVPLSVDHLKLIHLHVRNAVTTGERRFYTMAEKSIKDFIRARKQEDKAIEMFLRAVLDERIRIRRESLPC